MNNKIAKKLRKIADRIVLVGGHQLDYGKNEYNQAMNCKAWVPAFDEDGKSMKDPDGNRLLKRVDNPGTITHKEVRMVVYNSLKKLWKQDPNNPIFIQ